MNLRTSLQILAVTALMAMQSVPAGAAAPALKARCLGNCALQISLPSGWTSKKRVSFESETYVFRDQRGSQRFNLYLGSSPALASIRGAKRSTMLNGNPATEYVSRGRITDIVVRPRCGHDKYAWLTIVGTAADAAAFTSMRSLRCTAHG